MNKKINLIAKSDLLEEVFNAECTTSFISDILVVHVPLNKKTSTECLKYQIMDLLQIIGQHEMKVIQYDSTDTGILMYITCND